jgi:hypothetical protein
MKRSIAHAFAALAVLVGLGTAVSATAATPAYADSFPYCSGYGCDNQDPHTTGCDRDGQTVASAPIKWSTYTYGTVYLRWSQRCQSNWALVYIQLTSNPERLPRDANVARQSPYRLVPWRDTGSAQWIYGNMVYAPGCAEAIGVIDVSYATASGTAVNTWCTPF